MGLLARIAFHARDRHGAHCKHDHGKAQVILRRLGWGLAAGLIWLTAAGAEPFRVAVFHSELGRDGPGLLLRDILDGDEQVAAVQAVLSRVDADVLLLGGVDWDHDLLALRALNDGLETPYPHLFAGRPNRGIWRGDDGDGDGRLGEPEDAEGFGAFAGYEGAAILSRYPFGMDAKDYTALLWADLPGTLHGPDRPPDQKLSTTMHWNVPVETPDGEVRLWAWHATAPVFDGPQDENGRRNHDEALFWLNKLATLPPRPVILLGFANLDPNDGDGRPDALNSLLRSPRLTDPAPRSDGGRFAANSAHSGDPALDTADWDEDGPGNLRVDYVLPDARFKVTDAGVLWPAPGSADHALFGDQVRAASRHRVVWVDLTFQR